MDAFQKWIALILVCIIGGVYLFDAYITFSFIDESTRNNIFIPTFEELEFIGENETISYEDYFIFNHTFRMYEPLHKCDELFINNGTNFACVLYLSDSKNMSSSEWIAYIKEMPIEWKFINYTEILSSMLKELS